MQARCSVRRQTDASMRRRTHEMMAKPKTEACPCGGENYQTCCARFVEAGAAPETAEQLMRSRYTAYVRGNDAWLQRTWHPSTRPAGALSDGATRWLGLEVRRHEASGDEAIVEFIARYKIGGRAHRLHETSRFVREDGVWYYVDGTFPER